VIRVLIGDFPELRRKPIHAVIAEQDDMTAVLAGGQDLAASLREHQPDVLVTAAGRAELQLGDANAGTSSSDLQGEFPRLLVVALGNGERRVTLSTGLADGDDSEPKQIMFDGPDLGLEQLVDAIRAAASPGHSNVSEFPASASGDAIPFVSDWEYLTAELRRLDLLVHLYLERDPAHRTGIRDGTISDLFVSTGEVNAAIQTRPASQQPSEDAILRDLELLGVEIEDRLDASLEDGTGPALVQVCEAARLSEVDRRCLIVALAPRVDPKYQRVFGYIEHDASRRGPSPGLAAQLVASDPTLRLGGGAALTMAASFDPSHPLARLRLVRLLTPDPQVAAATTPEIVVDEYIARVAFGWAGVDPSIADLAYVRPTRGSAAPEEGPLAHSELVTKTCALLTHGSQDRGASPRSRVLHLYGAPGVGRRTVVDAVCDSLSLGQIVLDGRAVAGDPSAVTEKVFLAARNAEMNSAALTIDRFERVRSAAADEAVIAALTDAGGVFRVPIFLIDNEPLSAGTALDGVPLTSIPIRTPGVEEIDGVWAAELSRGSIDLDPFERRTLASAFRLTPGQIRQAVRTAWDLAAWRQPDDPEPDVRDLQAAARGQSMPDLGKFAQRIEPHCEWDDLVLPDEQAAQLRELVAAMRNRVTVVGQWGYARKLSRGHGISALFSGPSGTGKTMAAEVIAHEVGVELFRIDLAQVVSKYIGDTEKALDTVFTEAANSNALLLFDEADAVFGKRTEVRDSHDRFANIEVAYLLQRIELHPGTTILATNLKQNLDTAFLRRQLLSVDFTLPGVELRERIWRGTFPCETPLSADVDFRLLAEALEISGGHIRNIGLRAAFAAAEEGRGVVRMRHVWTAAQREYQKLDRMLEDLPVRPIAVPA